MKTTLNLILAANPCGTLPEEDGELLGYLKLLKYLGKVTPDDDPINIIQILDSNGAMDAVWCMNTVKDFAQVDKFLEECCKVFGMDDGYLDSVKKHSLQNLPYFAVYNAVFNFVRNSSASWKEAIVLLEKTLRGYAK